MMKKTYTMNTDDTDTTKPAPALSDDVEQSIRDHHGKIEMEAREKTDSAWADEIVAEVGNILITPAPAPPDAEDGCGRTANHQRRNLRTPSCGRGICPPARTRAL
jgi:hypothetical protein